MSARPNFDRQFKAAAANYDNQSPPEPVEYDYTDADIQIGEDLIRDADVAELVREVRESADFLNWIAYNVAVPHRFLHEFRELDRRAKRLSERASDLVAQEVGL